MSEAPELGAEPEDPVEQPEAIVPRPFTKGYKPSAEQLEKMRLGRERAKEAKANGEARPFANLFKRGEPVAGGGRTPKGKRPSPATNTDREVIRTAIDLANAALDLTGAGMTVPQGAQLQIGTNLDGTPQLVPHPLVGRSVYSMSPEEVEELADAWYEVAKVHSSFGAMLVKGRKFTAWGNLLFVSVVIVAKRVPIYNELSRQAKSQKAASRPAPPMAAPAGAPGVKVDEAGQVVFESPVVN